MIWCEGSAGALTTSGLAQRHKAHRPASGIDDAARSEKAQEIQSRHRGWLVMWSRWHQTFTAFCCFSPDRSLVVDEASDERLCERMRSVELYFSTARPGR